MSPQEETLTEVERMIAEECDAIRTLLVTKNRAYGNSALDPLRIFSRTDPEEQIRVRLDDKLSRLARGSAAGEDVEIDLLGYLILLRVSRRLRQRTSTEAPGAITPMLVGDAAACRGCGKVIAEGPDTYYHDVCLKSMRAIALRVGRVAKLPRVARSIMGAP